MPYIKPPPPSPELAVFLRVAATVWLNHLRCRVRRCRRDGCCLGGVAANGQLFCVCPMNTEETDEMMNFLGDTVEFATPQTFEIGLARAKTDEEGEMVAFRRAAFLYYHRALAEAGLEEPLGPPFIEG